MENNQKIIVFTVVALLIGAAIGAALGVALKPSDNNSSADETYNFYLYFDDSSNTKNGWYSATGSDAGAAFDKAMKDAGITYEVNKYGYLSSVDGNNGNNNGWFLAQYVYKDTTKAAADGSILYPVKSYGSLAYSNGWKSLSGYDDTSYTFKLSELNSTIYFLSPYHADYTSNGPTDVTSWMTTGPFKA